MQTDKRLPLDPHLQHIIQGDVAEALSCGGEDVGGLLHLMCLVPRHLTILYQCHLLLLADLVKLLLCLFDLPKVPIDKGCLDITKRTFFKNISVYLNGNTLR